MALKRNKSHEYSNSYFYVIVVGICCLFLGLYWSVTLFCDEPNETTIGLAGEKLEKAIENYYSKKGTVGDFIGGIVGTLVSLIGMLLLYLTLKKQQHDSEKQKIETRFFELLKIHRDNANEVVFRNHENKVLIEGRKVFKEIYNQIEDAILATEALLKIWSVDRLLSDEIIKNKNVEEQKDYLKFQLSYTIVFLGIAWDEKKDTTKYLGNFLKADVVKDVYNFFRLAPSENHFNSHYKSWKKVIETKILTLENYTCLIDQKTGISELVFNEHSFGDNSDLIRMRDYFKIDGADKRTRFGGHKHKLGHYFRHLYQTVNYIDNQKILSFDEKYDYIKTLRAQLSNYEQMVFFYNSIHSIGAKWEVKYRDTEKYNDEQRYSKALVSKYNFIKNIHNAAEIEATKKYPLVAFELEAKSSLRKTIKDKYWIN
jgi:hypothetical protein